MSPNIRLSLAKHTAEPNIWWYRAKPSQLNPALIARQQIHEQRNGCYLKPLYLGLNLSTDIGKRYSYLGMPKPQILTLKPISSVSIPKQEMNALCI